MELANGGYTTLEDSSSVTVSFDESAAIPYCDSIKVIRIFTIKSYSAFRRVSCTSGGFMRFLEVKSFECSLE